MKKIIISSVFLACILVTSLSAQVTSVIDYTYDARGQVTSIMENGTKLNCYYDAGGNRITRSQVIGINNQDAEKQTFRIYPNPAKNEVWIEYESAIPGNLEVAIYSVCGQQLITKTFKTNQSGMQKLKMDVSSLTNGLYAIRIVADSFSGSLKILKIN